LLIDNNCGIFDVLATIDAV